MVWVFFAGCCFMAMCQKPPKGRQKHPQGDLYSIGFWFFVALAICSGFS